MTAMNYGISVPEAVKRGISHYQTGDLQQAEAAFRSVIDVQPDHPDALHFLGLIAHHFGHHDDAIDLIARSIRSNPQNPYCHNNLGEAYRALGRLDEAEASYRKALSLKADFPEAHNNLGAILISCGEVETAIASCRKALSLRPEFPEAYNNLGNAFSSVLRYDEAIDNYQRAISVRADFPEAYNNLGNAQHALRNFQEAISAYRHALTLWPDFAEAYNNIGAALRDSGQYDEAIAAYQQALAVRPDYAEAFHNLGRLYYERGWFDDAEMCYRRTLSIDPQYIEACHDLGTLLNHRGKLDEALECAHKTLSISPDAAAYNNLGNAFRAMGRVDDAFAAYQKALDLAPELDYVFSNWLHVAQNGTMMSLDESRAAHGEYAARFEAPLRGRWPQHNNPQAINRRLKIGYVSADFCNHAVAYFMEPILVNHDRAQFEVYCYYNRSRQDAYTTRFMSLADNWIACHPMTDDELAARILDDGIDILVDLSGHTAGNRLPVFARKPAPVQVTYLGYATTSGLTAVDYRLTHAFADPVGNDCYYSETLYRLPEALWCYRPRENMPAVAPPPLEKNGYITFGSMNSLTKVSPATVSAWAEILRVLPGARLIMATVPEGSASEALRNQFMANGIGPERLVLQGRLSAEQFWALHAEIDIALDPFPYNGGTTTYETLWLGVPVVSLKGAGFVSRLGHTLLNQIGLPELVAESPAGYVEIATTLASDWDRLKELRTDMRGRVAASPLRDEVGFTRHLEAGYHEMWNRWCASRS